MRQRRSSVQLAIAAAGSLVIGITAAPAYGVESPTVTVEQADGPTDPAHLVNDPGADDLYSQHDQHTPSVAVAGSDLMASFDDGVQPARDTPFVGYSRSADGGRTWQDQGPVTAGTGLDVIGDSVVAADPGRSRFYLAAPSRDSRERPTGILVFRAATSGGPLQSPVAATINGSSPWLAVDGFPGTGGGTVYLAYRSPDGLRLVRSVNGGDTWTPSAGTLIAPAGLFVAPRVVVTPDHCVHYVWYADESGDPRTIAARTSCDRGVTFGPEVLIVDLGNRDDRGLRGNTYSNSYPQVAANPVTGALYVTYKFGGPGQGTDVWLTTSTDGGATWSTPTVVNTGQEDSDQYSPAIAVSDDGTRLLITYYDRRADRLRVDSQRWGRNAVIDTATNTVRLLNAFQLGPSFPPVRDNNPNGGYDSYSEYEALIFGGDAFLAAWTDHRDGDDLCRPQLALQLCAFQPDIRFAEVPTGQGAADVSVTTTAPDDAVTLGGEYSYTATVRNDGTRPAHNVFVRSKLPLAARFVSVSTDGSGVCNRLKQDVSCGLGTLAPGEAVSMTVTAQALASGPLKRKAVTSTSSPELRKNNNRASADSTVPETATRTETFSTGDLGISFRGGEELVFPLDIEPAAGTALDVDVLLRLNYSDLHYLGISLVSPSGRRVHLTSNNLDSTFGEADFGTGANRCSGTPTVFDDAATTSIIDGRSPFIDGTYTPEGTLADVAGDPYSGTWRLVLYDYASFPRGTIGCFKLEIRHTVD